MNQIGKMMIVCGLLWCLALTPAYAENVMCIVVGAGHGPQWSNNTVQQNNSVIDLNRAARFITRKLKKTDLLHLDGGSDAALPDKLYERLGCQDLRFDALNFGKDARFDGAPFPDRYFDKIAASLFISYIYNPDLILEDFYRMLRSGGLLLVSSMKPDSDISTLFTEYVSSIRSADPNPTSGVGREDDLAAARAMLNEAAALFTLEEDGYFRFYSEDELAAMFEAAGFVEIKTYRSLGNPAQAVVVTGRKAEK